MVMKILVGSFPDRHEQVKAIEEAINFGRNFYAIYDVKSDNIIIGNSRRVIKLTPEILIRPDYIDVAKYSFGRLLEACDSWLENVIHEGSA